MATVFCEADGLLCFVPVWSFLGVCVSLFLERWHDKLIGRFRIWGSVQVGCPNECLKLQADVAHTCTSLGIMQEEDLIKSPPFSAYSVSWCWVTARCSLPRCWLISGCVLAVSITSVWCEVESQVLSTGSWHFILHCSVSVPAVSLWYFWI